MSGSYYALDNEDLEETNSSKPCPEDAANIISRVTFWWAQKLLIQGNKKPLEQHDLYSMPHFLDSELLASQLVIDWNKKRPLVRALLHCFYRRFWFVPFFKFFAQLCVFANPFLLRTLIGAVNNGSTSLPEHPLFTNAWQVIVVLFLSTVIKATCEHRAQWLGMRCGLSCRGAVMGAVYRKALKMGMAEKRHGHTTGTVTNMIAVDADAVLYFMWVSVHDLYLASFCIVVLLALVCTVVGPVGILGFIVMVLAVPLNIWLTRSSTQLRSKARKYADERVRLINEVLQGIRILKLYHWVQPFRERIQTIRESQAFNILMAKRRTLWTTFVSALLPGAVLCITFAAYLYVGHTLDAQVAFTTIALFQAMKAPMSQIPSAFDQLSQFLIAVTRLESFLAVDDVKDSHPRIHASDGDIVMENAEFWWDPPQEEDQEAVLVKGEGDITGDLEMDNLNVSTLSAVMDMTDEVGLMVDTDGTGNMGKEPPPDLLSSPRKLKPTLHNINFKAAAGKLTCIVGPVGSGKTSLLHAILREVSPTSGAVRLPIDIGYTPQSAWLLTATLQDNVLFGRPMNKKRYADVLHACALTKDIKLLPNGDQTEIGEQGINLSGGQKQRVSLARALYANPQCYVLDEPLSAVDAHVATWLFDSCVMGMMKGSTRVLVTHQLQFLPMADSIIVLHQGMITHSGTYEQLVQQGIDFETLVRKKFEGKTDKAADIDDPTAQVQQGAGEGESEDISEQLEANSTPNKEAESEKPRGIISKEERQLGEVGWRVYRDYFAASGNLWLLFVAIAMYFVAQITFLVSDYWIVVWTGRSYDLSTYVYILVFFGTCVAFACVKRLAAALVQNIAHNSATNLHQRLLLTIMDGTAGFFDMTPSGRIINRFSKDQDMLDNSLPTVIQDCLDCGAIVLCSIGLICILTPYFTFTLILIVFLYYHIQKFYRKTSREVKRLGSISRSPIFSCFSETINGLTTIRAFKRQGDFIAVINKRITANQKTVFYEYTANRWLGVRLEWIASLIVLFASSFAIISMKALGPGLVGLLLATTLSFSQTLNWVVRTYTDLEVQMNAAERNLHYCTTTPQETTPLEITPPPAWPQQGAVEVRDLVIKYREDLDPVLRGISCSIRAGEKVGIVGRTGAGKSTLTTALFRMVEAASGSISIDGEDISKVGLGALRSRISIIPQDPVLFSGSIRMNLDPFLQRTDAELWEALRQVHLSDHVSSIPGKLDYGVAENGEGFSVGQRQLLCLGRALLRRTKILVMDEATASLDFNTDVLIRNTVRECFAANTLITIAHRLDTILDSDRVMVFEQGKIAEFDTPTALLANHSSKFSMLVEAARQAATRQHNH